MRGEYWPRPRFYRSASELPPRARRIPFPDFIDGTVRGTTSACAENTLLQLTLIIGNRNYLRVRGEYKVPSFGMAKYEELPPRARRIHFGAGASLWLPGTTSACAENTTCNKNLTKHDRNYLRVRGEYSSMSPVARFSTELPPRARRIQAAPDDKVNLHGTTSACAENTRVGMPMIFGQRNYLRVRGEYGQTPPPSDAHAELPPRARRIPNPTWRASKAGGTTSACAENTPGAHGRPTNARNYLRVRGEYRNNYSQPTPIMELPPRARRILQAQPTHATPRGTTSACAENTPGGGVVPPG